MKKTNSAKHIKPKATALEKLAMFLIFFCLVLPFVPIKKAPEVKAEENPIVFEDTITLESTATGTGYNNTESVLTFDSSANGKAYKIMQTNPETPLKKITVNDGVTTTLVIEGINMTGDIDLVDKADVTLLLSRENTINGTIIVADRGDENVASITIDSATTTGSNKGELSVTAAKVTTSNSATNAGIGGTTTYKNAGKITINEGTVTANGGTVTATGGSSENRYNGTGAGIGGGAAYDNNNTGDAAEVTITGESKSIFTRQGRNTRY